MKLGLLVFGQFRAWEDVLEDNIKTLEKQFTNYDVDVFILTDTLPSGMYSKEAEHRIHERLSAAGFSLKHIFYWEDQIHLHTYDTLLTQLNKTFLGDVEPTWKNDWMMNLWYRRYILWKLVEESVDIHEYSVFFFARIFDTYIEIKESISEYLTDHETLYTCIDTLFFGSPALMKLLFQFGSSFSNWKHFEWTPEFKQAFLEYDQSIGEREHTLCSESQVFYYIYTTIPKWKNIRIDFNKSGDTNKLNVRIIRHMPIPRKITQIALGDAYIASLPLELLHHNLTLPNPGFEYRLLTTHDCLEFLIQYFPNYLPLFHSLQRPQYKSDLIRYLWLYIHGGWYIDIDLLPMMNLRALYEMTEQAELVVSFGANYTFEMANGFLAAVPGHPLFLDLVQEMAIEPNPSDYGMNVKRMFRICTEKYGIEPFQKRKGVFAFLEAPSQPGNYFIWHYEQPVVVSNGNGYPPKA